MNDFLPVLLGSDINVYGMARSFHEAYGMKSVAVGKGRLSATMDSRIVSVEKVEPDIENDDIFVRTLREFSERYPKGLPKLLVSCGDNYTRLLAKNADRLKDLYRFRTVPAELIDRLTTKDAFYRLADEHGLEYPKTAMVSKGRGSSQELGFGFPVVVKPADSVAYWNCSFPHKKKVFVAESREEYDEILAAIYGSSYQEDLIIQEFIPGDDSHMRVMNCYSDADGKVRLASLAQALLEEHSPEGIGSYAALIPVRDDGITEKLKGFLEAIGYVGFSNFDMKLDERDGKYKLFEINPRQGRSSFVVTAAGSNLARVLAGDVIYGEPYEFFTEDREVLWSIIPDSVIKRYVSDEALKAKAAGLIAAGKVVRSLWYPPDMSLGRRVYYLKNQMGYKRKYARYFGNKALRD
ncbi:MAG: ATP-grasp domain-containing protein [Clostridiales Family XIII bacterium]|jgi:D-aspartate ligase|nr:ATP-grasp domain-containing protein [Clostridiales Family XIII bacterium]